MANKNVGIQADVLILGNNEDRHKIAWKAHSTSPRGIWLISSWVDGWYAVGSSGDAYYMVEVFKDVADWSYCCKVGDGYERSCAFSAGTGFVIPDDAKIAAMTAAENRARLLA